MEGVEFWPRLIHVIPPEQKISIDNSRNELSFLVNMSILCIAFYFLSVVAMFYFLATLPTDPVGAHFSIDVILKSLRYLVAGGIAAVCSWFFYKASIYSVGSFGLMIRSAYDLFRIELLKRFRLKVPADSWEEFFTWQNLNEFIVLGRHSLKFKKLKYYEEK
jgi:hypothetical protein